MIALFKQKKKEEKWNKRLENEITNGMVKKYRKSDEFFT